MTEKELNIVKLLQSKGDGAQKCPNISTKKSNMWLGSEPFMFRSAYSCCGHSDGRFRPGNAGLSVILSSTVRKQNAWKSGHGTLAKYFLHGNWEVKWMSCHPCQQAFWTSESRNCNWNLDMWARSYSWKSYFWSYLAALPHPKYNRSFNIITVL